ncbi:MAG: CdaR family protein [Candidatus Limnocylindrales bacterium]
MNPGRALRRLTAFVVHNWPLKLAAIVLASLLYAGLVASQDSNTIPGPITVLVQNQPDGTVVTNQLKDVEQIRYLATAGAAAPRPGDFRATVDLTNVRPDGEPVNVPVRVIASDPAITIIDVTPRTVQVILEKSVEKPVPVRIAPGAAPAGIDVGEAVYDPKVVTITGAASAVMRVVAVLVSVPLDPRGIDVDREIEARPIDVTGTAVTGVDVEPRTVHVQIPLLTNKESRALPVNPVVSGAPAPGFRVAAIAVTPISVTVEGDADQLAALVQIDTAPVSISGATANVAETVTLALPSGITATGSGAVTVRVQVVAVTETRTYSAGLRLDGRDPALEYGLSVDRVLLTLFGPVAELDKLSAAPLFIGLNVAGLEPGTHEVTVVPVLPAGVTPAQIAPGLVTVTITRPAASADPANPTSAPSTTGGPIPSASP